MGDGVMGMAGRTNALRYGCRAFVLACRLANCLPARACRARGRREVDIGAAAIDHLVRIDGLGCRAIDDDALVRTCELHYRRDRLRGREAFGLAGRSVCNGTKLATQFSNAIRNNVTVDISVA